MNRQHPFKKIAVIGAGSWGTAIANLLAKKGLTIHLWAFEQEVVESINTQRENKVFLPGIDLSHNLLCDSNLKKTVSDKDLIILVIPSHVFRATIDRVAEIISPDSVLVTASKGIETHTGNTMHGILCDVVPQVPSEHKAVLSGPSFAREVAKDVPTVVTVAAKSHEVAVDIQNLFATPFFRVYTSTDIVGLELGGAVKNVIAIASGITDGMGLGLNTRAALLTRGLAEIRRLGAKLGAHPDTIMGLGGFGDLVLTATGSLSRNYTFGQKIGKGQSAQDILASSRMVVEGFHNAKTVCELAENCEVEMPISHAVYRILYEGLRPKKAVMSLMTRELKPEVDALRS
ncbi:MAG: glycerol-3-phosphate dehydrogenase [Acidobacteria bacterium]|nr:MAG: glycerol-3-phosphate dehydrogenase [Acidobacteriota bacterium]